MTDSDLPEEVERDEKPRSTKPAPRTRMGGGGGFLQFPKDVASEMKRVSWPTRADVVSTTVVVLIAVAFFGVYIWIVDSGLAAVFTTLEAWLQ